MRLDWQVQHMESKVGRKVVGIKPWYEFVKGQHGVVVVVALGQDLRNHALRKSGPHRHAITSESPTAEAVRLGLHAVEEERP
jgi:hypothetical protein